MGAIVVGSFVGSAVGLSVGLAVVAFIVGFDVGSLVILTGEDELFSQEQKMQAGKRKEGGMTHHFGSRKQNK